MRWREESERRQDGSRALLSYQRQAGATADSGVVSDARKERKAKGWVGGRKCGKIGAAQGTAGKQTWAKSKAVANAGDMTAETSQGGMNERRKYEG